jgi:hypothetical protein
MPNRTSLHLLSTALFGAVSLLSLAASAQFQGAVTVTAGGNVTSNTAIGVAPGVVAQPVNAQVAVGVPGGPVPVQGWMGPQPMPQPYAQPIAVPVTGPVGPQATINLQIPNVPPPQQPDRFAPPSQPGQVWIPGRWHWNNGAQQWIPGHWETPPQQGQVWMQPQWGRRGRRAWYRPGFWGQPQQIGGQFLQPGAFGIQAQVTPLQVGQIVTGILDNRDYHRPEGGYADDYAVFLQAGQPVTFVVTGGPSTQSGQLLDVVASIHFQGRELASDDDGAGFPHARLTFTPPASGVYALRVASYGAHVDMGSYTVQSWLGAVNNAQPFNPGGSWGWAPGGPQLQPQPMQPQPMQPQPVVFPQPGQPMPGQPMAAQPLQLNTTIQGALQQGDLLSPRNSFMDQYLVTLQAGQAITVVARGIPGWDPMRRIQTRPDVTLDLVCNGQTVGHDDDSAGNQNARLVITPQVTTQCVVQVSTFGAGASVGAYQLTTVFGANPTLQ